MENAVDQRRYSTVAIILHWLIALALIFQFAFGWRLEGSKGPTGFIMFQMHKSLGITILLLSLARLAWRLTHPVPPPPVGQPAWERRTAKIVHAGFYVIMLGLPLTGWLMVSTDKKTMPIRLFGKIPWPQFPGFETVSAATRATVNNAADVGHHALLPLTMALVLLHFAGVARHQFLRRDTVFARMAPGARPGWRDWRIWLAGVAVIVTFVLAKTVTPPASAIPANVAAAASSPT